MSEHLTISDSDGWQDAATAPRDGSWFLGWNDRFMWQPFRFEESSAPEIYDGFFYAACRSNSSMTAGGLALFTHWMPCPAPPCGKA